MKNYIKLKIRDKLLLLNFIIIFLIIMSQLLLQSVFFEHYYEKYKKRQLNTSLLTFEKLLPNKDKASLYIEKLFKNDDIYLFYLDQDLNVALNKFDKNAELILTTLEGEDIVMPNILIPPHSKTFGIGSTVLVVGYRDKTTGALYVNTLKIQDDGDVTEIIVSAPKNSMALHTNSYEHFETMATVTSYQQADEMTMAYSRQFLQFAKILNNQGLMDSDKLTLFAFDYMIVIKKVQDHYILGAISLKGSKDILMILTGFNMYIMIPNMIIAIIIIFFYSKRFTKPLLLMKSFAQSIAHHDYSQRIQLNSEDELQELGDSLNDITTQLDRYMHQLKKEYEDRLETEKSQKFLLMNISHDLKTPLTVIKGYLKAIKDGIYDKDTYIDDTIEGVDDISNTLNEMLELAKLKSNSKSLHLQPTDLTRLTYQTYDRLKGLSKEAEQKITLRLMEDAFVNVDEQEMKKVLENLLINAMKYSPPRAHIHLIIEESDDHYIFSIENENSHIPEEEIKNIFKEFYRVDKSRNKTTGGHGLGLVIVKSILDNHSIPFQIMNTTLGVKFQFTLKKYQ